jgi:hypothetical protein
MADLPNPLQPAINIYHQFMPNEAVHIDLHQENNALPPVQGGGAVPQGLPPRANVPPAQGGVAPHLEVNPPTKTFLKFYEDPSKDPCGGRYERIMQRFDPAAAVPVPPEVLFEQAVGSPPSCHQAYLCCAPMRRSPRIFCLHAPSRFVGALDGIITPWDNTSYAFLGDETQGIATSIIFPTNIFNVSPAINVYTTKHLMAHLPALNGLEVFAALPADANAGIALPVTTRYAMYLPLKYAKLFMDSSGYSIKHIWQVLTPLLDENDNRKSCQALLNWLQVASHGSMAKNAQGQPVVGPLPNSIPLIAPAADKDLIVHRNDVLKQALLGLGHTSQGLETAIYQMANAMMMNTADQRIKANEALQPILPSTKFKSTLPILMDYLQIGNEMDLPQLWHQWANASKRQEFRVLREILEAYARGPEAFSHLAPVVSAKLVQDLLMFTFIGDSQDDIKVGLQPFTVADGSEEFRLANLELARIYGLLNDSSHGVM